MIDCGVTFGDDSQPGRRSRDARSRLSSPNAATGCSGIVATHAHEDHIGAIPYLWKQLRCPIWATPFTASLLRAKLAEAGLADQVRINVVPLSGRFAIGPFDLELITLTHSIPEPNAVALRTPVGTVLHTGDWKFDPDPLIGPTADEAALRRLGDEGVLAMVGDSTNALRPGHLGVRGGLRRVPDRSDRPLRCPGRGRLLRLECGAARNHRPRRCRATAARWRWSGARCGGWTRRRARTAISPTCRDF